jgi:hypothetical protein
MSELLLHEGDDAAAVAAMIATPDEARSHVVARHIATEYARDSVMKALYEAVVDGLEFGPRDLPLADDRAWIRGNLAVPLQEATDAALQVLVWSVSRALERAPNGLLERFERSHQSEELSVE